MVLSRRDATKVPEGTSPTIRRRELGARLRELRIESGLTVEQVAEKLICSTSKISRLETGHRGVIARDIRDLCDIYRVGSAECDYLIRLAVEGTRRAWWQPYDLPYATYVGLESAAVMISDFDPGVFPGLLQTPDYARALHERGFPLLSPAKIEQRIDERQARQKLLGRDDPPRLAVIIDEAVVRRAVGGPEVMARQFAHVTEMIKRSNITVQVLPYSAGAHPALDSTFTVLEFTPPVPGVVFVEGLVGQIYLERDHDVERYKKIYAQLADLALPPERSAELMAHARAALLAE
jgi:transcriptional regulator with XRE-family HTH domain